MSSKFGLKFSGFDVVIGVISVVLALLLLLINNIAFSNKVLLDDKVAFVYYNSIKFYYNFISLCLYAYKL